MRNIYIIIVLCGMLCFSNRAGAQDYHFSQFYANPLYLSPSLAGATDGGRLIVNYRNQWPEISQAFSTYALSFDNFFSSFNSGIGVSLMQDKAGSAGLTTTNAAFQYSYNLKVTDDWQVVPAIQFAYGNKYVDFNKIIMPDQSTGGSTGAYNRLSNDQIHYIDMATSVFVYSPKYWAGLTVDHLTRPNYTFMNEEYKADLRYVLFGGMNIWQERRRRSRITMQRSFSFSFRYERQKLFNQLDLGFYWHNSPIELGVWYRGLPVFNNSESTAINHDAIIALVAYDFGPLRVGYSYDITISGLGWSTAGAHELSLIYEFNQRKGLRAGGKRPAVPCSASANPLNSVGGKYTKKRRRLY